MHRKALGRGLEALIPAASEGSADRGAGAQLLAVEDIGPNPFQPRTHFDDNALQELSASIKASGVLQPVLVRRLADGYQLVAGERRLRAAQLAGLEKIPAVLRQVDDRQMMELALIENVQREDLNPIDEAKAYKALVTTVGLTHEQLSERIGKQRSSISNALRLLTLPAEVQDMVSRGTLSAGHARALLGLESTGDQLAAARYVVSKGFSVRRTEAFVNRKSRRVHKKPRQKTMGEFVEWENKLQQRFSTKVRITSGAKGGLVEFEYYGNDDLERLFEAWGVL
jgi:ParB family transcriptional regulator, chromosome partitioning protein